MSTGHTEVVDEAVAPSCTETGLTEGKHCLVCGVTLCEQIEIEALGHTEVADKGYEATATKEGLTDGSHCSVCNEVIVKQEIIPVLFILGDVDGDDIVTVLDATYIQLHLAQLVIISDERFDYADADKNGEITILDASLIQRYVAQLIPEL
ncbi:MAG: dockerin type I repeat-containing protein [Eubacteriales bacterium]|nr:dockerin type I repeat-containing protein [Eubacteriales bacterium]